MQALPEKWRTIPGWPNHEASTLGRFRKKTCRIRKKTCRNGRGYLIPSHDLKVHVQKYDQTGHEKSFVCLWDKNRHKNESAGRLVLLTFVGPPPSKEFNTTRHLDDNIRNNRIDNLVWGTPLQNVHDAIRNKRRITYGENVHTAKLSERDIIEIRTVCRPWSSAHGVRTLAKRFGVDESTITRIINNRAWKQVPASIRK